ncbi:acylneuraminate cytidylyltransferase family protein [Sinomonas sp. ASV322]|uniref:acylneuraminate cytidylyltransferase family protein n=1 Tax=Sinomonas sp. ASV322 TaxID=3041920 RepID=UPI0027DC2A43|nr:acylneuraminate cytidylyltransferase family protein [Sinomonas sp. ASV322]MDQ4501904.1 acylneuraminate cytidylyltransferase family protein [Sinomonas sp. ASV322]
MRILCVIPARGGSKGIPRKNLRHVGGKPLVVWTIEQALGAAAGLDVLVSTDDEEIALLAAGAGADVPFVRPSFLARDESPTEPVVEHAIAFRTEQGRRPDAVMLLQATSPIRLPGTIDRAVGQFVATDVDSLVGVVPQTPFLWTMGEKPGAAYAVDARPRRQDLAERDYVYRETGSLYLTRTRVYEEAHNRLGGCIGLFVMDETEGIDIDTHVDLVAADLHLSHLHAPGGEPNR